MRAQRTIAIQALVLRKKLYGENNLLVTLYSKDLGKIEAVAKGGKKMTNNFAGHLEPLNICNIQLHKSAYRFTVTQTQVEEHFKTIKNDFKKSLLAQVVLEIFYKSTPKEESNENLFSLVIETLQSISKEQQEFLIFEHFKIKLLEELGILPNFDQCLNCEESTLLNTENFWFDSHGHTYCGKCYNPEQNSLPMDQKILKLLSYLREQSRLPTFKIAVSERQKQQLKTMTNHYLHSYINQEIISEKMLGELQ